MQIKNVLIRFFVALLKPVIKKHHENNFLIVSTTGLGDTLWGTPAIRALREAHPDAYIGVLTSSIGAQVLQNNPHITELFTLKKSSLVSLYFSLKRRRIGTIFIFHTSQRAVLPFCALLGARRIVGSTNINKDLDFLLTDPIEHEKVHEIERRLKIVGQSQPKWMEIFPSAKDDKTVLPGDFVIGMHPGAKDLFKQWPPEHFIELGKKLKEHLGCHIVVTGTPAEKKLVETVASGIGAIGIFQNLSILGLAALMKRFSLFITNDTGPLHIACATKTPTIALFTPTEPHICGPYFAPHVKTIQKKPTCSPCLRKKCQDPFCMRQISPTEVLKKALSLLEEKTA